MSQNDNQREEQANNAAQTSPRTQPASSSKPVRQLRSYWDALLRLLADGGMATGARSAPDGEVWPERFPTRETIWDGEQMTAVQLPNQDQWLLVRPSFWQQVVDTARSLREGIGQTVTLPSANPERLRRQLVSKLLRDGTLNDPDVARAMLKVPRHMFLPQEPIERAYADDAVVTKQEGNVSLSSASQPAMVTIMLEQLALRPGLRVLEVGAGTGYNAALMAELVGATGHVTTIDIDQDIVDDAQAHLGATGYRDVETVCGDGAAGYPSNAPYDRIILTVGASDIASAWREQLADGGVLLLPLSVGGVEQSVAFRREGDVLRSLSARPCGFIRLRGLLAAPELRVVSPDHGLVCVALEGQGINAHAIRSLLDQPVRAEAFPLPPDMTAWWRWSLFTLFSTLQGDRPVDFFDRDGRLDGEPEKRLPGFYDPNDNSLVLVDGVAGRLLLLGGTGAAQRLRRRLVAFESVGFWEGRRLSLEAYPAGTLAAAPADAWLLRRPFSDVLVRME